METVTDFIFLGSEITEDGDEAMKLKMLAPWKKSYDKPVLVAQSCPTLCDPMDYRPPCSSVHGILQVRILEWIAIPFSRDLPNPGIEPGSPAL